VTGADDSDRPALRIVRGAPTEQEIAALVTVLAAAGAAADDVDPKPPGSQWAAPHRLTRPVVTPSGWWASALPR
jgi:hypothetical protein